MGKRCVAAYVRTSSRAQSYAMQEAAIKAGPEDVDRWYREKLSGKSIARPELERLRADVRAGRISTVIVYRLDRLSRSGIRDTFEVVEELREHGCDIITVADGFDFSGPAAEIVLAVLAWSAKMERLSINERISAARDRIEEEGGSWGRPRRIDNIILEKAVAMKANGRSIRQIAMALKIPKSTVQRSLASQKDA